MINKNSRYYYQFALCGKSGYTTKANHTFVASAEKDGHVLIASFLNATDKNQNFFDMQTVFNYGFDNFSFVKLYDEGQEVAQYDITRSLTIPLFVNRTIEYPVEKGKENSLSYELKIEDKDLSKVSFEKDENILDATLYVNGKEVGTIDLYSGINRTYEPLVANTSLANNPKAMICAIIGAASIIAAICVGIAFKRKFSVRGRH